MNQEDNRTRGKVPVKEGLFPWPLPEDETPHLIGSRCGHCGQSFFPRRSRCSSCQERGEIEEIALSRTGKLYTFTIIRQAPAGFRAPYATALVDLPEGVRIFAQLTTTDQNEIQLDCPVELTFGPIGLDKEGNEVISYLFKPVHETKR